jgi:anti-anti-sigma regulatory factor
MAMRIQRSTQQGRLVLTLAGRLDPATPQVQRAILKQLASPPPAIIRGLGQVEAIDPRCAGVFTSIRHPAFGWPGTALVLCGTRPAVTDAHQDRNLMWLLAATQGADRGLGRLIAERVTTAWGSTRTRLAARSRGARWTRHHRTLTWPAVVRSRRPVPTGPPWSPPQTMPELALLPR